MTIAAKFTYDVQTSKGMIKVEADTRFEAARRAEEHGHKVYKVWDNPEIRELGA